MSAADWLHLLLFQFSLSLLAVGGAATLAPDLHRFVVQGQGWLAEAQFSSAITLAQVAPGPNVLFVALVGWNLGLNAAGAAASAPLALGLAALGLGVCLFGTLLPSSLLTLLTTRWARQNHHRLSVRAFRQGMAPLVVGILMSTAWLLAHASSGQARPGWPIWSVVAIASLLVWRTRVHLLWLLAVGAGLGAMGLV